MWRFYRKRMNAQKLLVNIKITDRFLSVFLQMKTPPDRSGITFEVGAQLEARDRHKNWLESQTKIHTK